LAENLVVSASNLQLSKEISFYKVEVNFRSSLLGNLEHWQVFEDNNQLLHFLQNEGEFSEARINLFIEKESIKIIDVVDGNL